MNHWVVVTLVTLLTLPASLTFAQTTNAMLSGTVIDRGGAVVPNAQITFENVETGIVLTTRSNEAGVYLFPNIQPGLYRLTAELPGFKKYVMSDVRVAGGARMNINVPLEVAATAETVEVRARPDSPLLINTPTVGAVIGEKKIQDLPLPDRDVLGLVLTQPGLVGDNFGGTRISALNVTRDGINVMDQRINSGVNSVVLPSIDSIQEVRVITSPVDAELGRGSGQVQLISRSGTNAFHGSIYETHNDTSLNANNWFNNLEGLERDSLILNEFGGRIGGPIKENRTFFHFTYDGSRVRSIDNVTSLSYTQSARNGIFRFYPNVQNANANATRPTVDVLGNPVAPSPTAQLQSVNLFNRDPFRPGPDPTGTVRKLLDLMPLPNDFRAGDGLNVAGHTWRSRSDTDFSQFTVKIDHLLNDRHRLNFSVIRLDLDIRNGFMPQPFPNSVGGTLKQPGTFYSLNLSSTFSSRTVNEFRAGAQRGRVQLFAPWESPEGRQLLPTANGVAYLPVFLLASDPIPTENDPQGRISPLYTFGDTLYWNKGRHALKLGGDIRFVSTNGFNSFNVMPRVLFGSGNGPGVLGVDSFTINGLGLNEGVAQALLLDLNGSVGDIIQAFNATGGNKPEFRVGETKQRTWRQREFDLFAQDDFKIHPRLTLNLGLRYEFYSVPWDAQGRTAGLVGGSNGLFGISGNSWSDLYQPGHYDGNFTQVQLIGKASPNPNSMLYNNDWNNLAPAIGLSWSLPYFGKDKTVLRAGYSVAYERAALRLTDIVAGDQPGLRTETTFTTEDYLGLGQISLPLRPAGLPLEIVPLEDRTQVVRAFDNNLRTPYTQHWNLSIQRELPQNFTLDVRYVGNKGTKLLRAVNINEVNILENGILDAFVQTQRGENAPLFDRLFNGFNLGLGVINGRTVTGSASIRQFQTTRAYLANNNVGDFAAFLNSVSVGGLRGELLRIAGFPENWIVGNPQFDTASYVGNFSNSSYHSLQINTDKRFTGGWQLQSNYTWSKALGEEEGNSQDLQNSYRNSRNRHIDKRRLAFDITHVFRNSGSYELPFGPGRRFLSNTNPILGRVLEGWQVGSIFNLFSGSPMGFGSTVTSLNQFIDNTATLVSELPKDAGAIKRTDNGILYFDALKQVDDPMIANLTALQLLSTRSTLKAITDASGKLLVMNPSPGTLGSLSQTHLEGPGSFRFDLNVLKRIRLPEGRELELRADALNVLNTPQFGNPITDINSLSFGRITAAAGSRFVRLGGRLTF